MAYFMVTFRSEPVELYHFQVKAPTAQEALQLVEDHKYRWDDHSETMDLLVIEYLEDCGGNVVEVADEEGDTVWSKPGYHLSGQEGEHNALA